MAKKEVALWKSSQIKDRAFDIMGEKNAVIIILDVETTGLDCTEERVIEFSAIKCRVLNAERLDEVERLDRYIRPPFSISPAITAITGISDTTVQNMPNESCIFPEIQSFLEDGTAILGYNVSFDIRFLKAMYERNGQDWPEIRTLDVMGLAKNVINAKLDSFSLSNVVKHLGLDKGIIFHCSMEDVVATYRLFEALFQKIKERRSQTKSSQSNKRLYKPGILSIRYWQGPRHDLQRVYVRTSLGSVYYDLWYHGWKSNGAPIANLDMEHVQNVVLWREKFDSDLDGFERFARKKCRDKKKK